MNGPQAGERMRPVLLLAALAALLLAGCTRTDDAPGAAIQPARDGVADAPAPALAPGVIDISLLDGVVDPGRTTVEPGTTVYWRNAGDTTHSVVSDDGAFSGSGPIPPAEAFSFTFQTPGEYRYHCRYHPEMTGSILVR